MKQVIFFMLSTFFFSIIRSSPSEATIFEETNSNESLFNHIYQIEGVPSIKITTNVKKLVEDKLQEAYQTAHFQIIDPSAKSISIAIDAQIKARGNTRKKVSYLPPVKLKFDSTDLSAFNLKSFENLKLVFPYDDSNYSQEFLMKEYLLYEIYGLINPTYLRTKLVNISLIWKGKERMNFTGFIIEDKEHYAKRINGQLIENSMVDNDALDKASFTKMAFFQYMIANTDWSVSYKHNLKMIQLPDVRKVIAVPYDFDYSGFVGQHYAIPHPVVPIDSVHERFFYPEHKLNQNIFKFCVDYYLSLEEAIYQICDNATYMNPKTIKKSKTYLKDFFDELRDTETLMTVMVRN